MYNPDEQIRNDCDNELMDNAELVWRDIDVAVADGRLEPSKANQMTLIEARTWIREKMENG